MLTTLQLYQTPLAHHDGSGLYVDNPQPNLHDTVILRIRTSIQFRIRQVYVRTVRDGEPKYIQASIDKLTQKEIWWKVPLVITNSVTHYRFLCISDTPPTHHWLNARGLCTYMPSDAYDFALTTYHVPQWTRDAVMYQIFPDRFALSTLHPLASQEYPSWAHHSNWNEPIQPYPQNMQQFYGGSLWGIIEHLNHVEQLGINLIYLTPFFPSRSNHRYDASSFHEVDPLLGGNSALQELISQAHKKGIKVIGDLTLNHSGSSHPWFLKGRDCPDSEEHNFYYFDSTLPIGYASFSGVSSLPKFNHSNMELRKRLYEGAQSSTAYFMREFNLDGWRIDVAQSAGIYGADNFNHDVARITHNTMQQVNPESLLLAEHQFDASESLQGDGWQGTMAYAGFTKPVWAWLTDHREHNDWGAPGGSDQYDGIQMVESIKENQARIPWQTLLTDMTLLDSHDTARFASVATQYYKLGIVLQFTFPGIPSVYYGDEIGLHGTSLDDGRQPFPWNHSQWDTATLDLYKHIIALRHNHSALRTGGLRWLHVDHEFVIFARENSDETLLITINRGSHSPVISPINAHDLLSGQLLHKGDPIPADANTAFIWQVEQ
ncbi:alpha-glycosidase [Galliscardovia ingluviei]|uniref:Alpha-glycosidase n=1 Tax=Galliscardovia ingluviei TaxID=1769422 RepID=A0A8J3AFI3_9BIFI|nr:glycoside hydrolase family 13 protein [Galliscardovia ingluviei]GGI12278.1 alpha-glycosidase [Galliscardovia ingluviei]